jgi:hypothetical protein
MGSFLMVATTNRQLPIPFLPRPIGASRSKDIAKHREQTTAGDGVSVLADLWYSTMRPMPTPHPPQDRSVLKTLQKN